ncbi:DUF1349 domain-containing protein [Anaeromyxobacter paludicola]|uniref:Cytochrome c family protein n=1 Tax=Anaeromyxobacter paludicola TaxID=2918171 RepID=A0ABN6N5S1_9BACT|nr:DUF1349 domain-containing protein [Anaeromyxobacter paludicola]BDG07297.1 hypothetical protein AMPC_04100 [Anaeromyxobacter paludicola]
MGALVALLLAAPSARGETTWYLSGTPALDGLGMPYLAGSLLQLAPPTGQSPRMLELIDYLYADPAPLGTFQGPPAADERSIAPGAVASLWLSGTVCPSSLHVELLDYDPNGAYGQNPALVGSIDLANPTRAAAPLQGLLNNAAYVLRPGHSLQVSLSAHDALAYADDGTVLSPPLDCGIGYDATAGGFSRVTTAETSLCAPGQLSVPAGQGVLAGSTATPASLVAGGGSGVVGRFGLAQSDGFAAVDSSKWTRTDLGNGAGSAPTASGGVLTLGSTRGSSVAGYVSRDSLNFLSQPVAFTGDFTVDVKVEGFSPDASRSATAAIMVRQALDPKTGTSAMAAVALTRGGLEEGGSGSTSFVARATAAAYSSQQLGPATTRPPRWLRLSRSGGSLTGWVSGDGETWAQIGVAKTVALTGTFYVGIVASNAYDYDSPRPDMTASFSQFVVTQPELMPATFGAGAQSTAGWAPGTYWLLAKATDAACGNTVLPAMGPLRVTAHATTLGDFATAESPNVPQACPSAGSGTAREIDRFTLAAAQGDTVTALKVAIGGNPAAIQTLSVTSDDGATVYGQVSPSGATPTVTLSTPIAVPATPTQYRLSIVPASYGALPPGEYPVSARVIAVASDNTILGQDAGSATVTVDRQPPSPPTGWTAVADGLPNEVALAWTRPAADFAQAVVLRSAGGAPVQATALQDGASYQQGASYGADVAAYVGAGQTYADQAQGGVAFRYLAFFGDACHNYSAGVPAGPVTPALPAIRTTVGALSATAGFCAQVNLSAAFSGDGDLDNAATFGRGTSPLGPFTPVTCAPAAARGLTAWTCVDGSPVSGGIWYYQATFTDPDGIAGATSAVAGPVGVAPCAEGQGALTVTALGPTPDGTAAPGAVNVTAGKVRLSVANGSVSVTSLAVSNGAAAPAAPGEILSIGLHEDLGATPGTWDAGDSRVASGTYDSARKAWVLSGFSVAAGDHDYVLTIAVAQAADPTTGEQFRATFGTGDVGLVAGARLLGSATVTGGTVTVAGTLTGAVPGDATPQSLVPMVSILSPGNGTAVSGDGSGRIRVQVQVYDPSGGGLSSVKLSRDAGASGTFTDALALKPAYAAVVGPNAALYQADLAFSPGSFVLQAQAVSASGKTGYSSPAVISVNARRAGDGNLLGRANSSQLCVDCHNVKTHSSQSTADPATGLSKYGAWSTTCRDCHTPHNTHNAQLLRETIVPPAYAGYVPAKKVIFQDRKSGDSGTSSAAVSFVTSNPALVSARTTGPCQACHTRTSSPAGVARWRGTGNQDAGHYAGDDATACTGCHSHRTGFRGREAQGGEACATCHGAKLAGMQAGARASAHVLGAQGASDAAQDDGASWGNPLAANAPAARSCVNMCHPDHVHNDPSAWPAAVHASNLHRSPKTAASRALTRDTNPSSATYGQATAATGAGVLRADHVPGQAQGCIACHQNPVDASRPYVDPARYDASAHNTTAAGGVAWEYVMHDDAPGASPAVSSRLQRNCTKCHAGRQREGQTPSWRVQGDGPVQGPHWSDDPALLAGALAPAGDSTRNVCYNCHGGGGSAGKDYSWKNVAQPMASAGGSRHPADAVAPGQHDAVLEAAAGYGTRLGGAPRHAGCTDCHDPHQAQAGLHAAGSSGAGGALRGAMGASLGALPAWTAPADASYWTAKRLEPGADPEASLCFRCHSAYYWGSGPAPTSPGLGAPYTDQAREFNPSNVSFHPVLSDCSRNVARIDPRGLSERWNRTANTNRMTCTDCHADASGAAGPHGGTTKFMLKGPNTNWNANTSWRVNRGQTGAQGIFCFNCHDPNFTYTRFRDSTRNLHTELIPIFTVNGVTYEGTGKHANIKCQTCHSPIPHGSPRRAFLAALYGPGSGAGGVAPPAAPEWDGQPTPYDAGSTLYLRSYPLPNSLWQGLNCGCTGAPDYWHSLVPYSGP